jgi:hypothetical protein
MAKAGTALQLGGLTLTGLGLLHGLATGEIKRELLFLGLGAGLFVLGWLLSKRGSWQS